MNPTRKIAPLEAYRGIAAIVVFLHHFCLAFIPALDGTLPELRDAHSLAGTPLYLLVNGNAAVVFFFVLSGYVLTARFYETGDLGIIRRGLLKRLLRLAVPTTVTTLASAALLLTGAYRHVSAGAVSGSYWLANFGSPVPTELHPSWRDALVEGAFATFFRGDSTYNRNLWTMRIEFLGSLLAFALAVLFLNVLRSKTQIAVFSVMLAAVFWWVDPVYVAFLAGTLLARFRPAARPTLKVALPGVLVGLYCLSYFMPSPWYPLFEWGPMPLVVQIAGTCLVIRLTLACPELYAVLDNSAGRWLGRLSFPIYLTQLLVLFSFSCWLYLRIGSSSGALAMNLVATAAVVLLVSLPLMFLDEWWVTTLNRLARSVPPAILSPVPFL